MTTYDVDERLIRRPDQWRGRLQGALLLPGQDGYDRARAAWNLEVDQHPAMVVLAECATDVQEAVRTAAALGLGVAVQATGHGVSRPCDGGVLVVTSRMDDVVVDPVARRARVGAGALWRDVVDAAAVHGLATLPGSSTGVGVVGYTLGGGFGWLGRRYGLAAHSVTRAELVTADGQQLVASADEHPELFWGLLGGTGNFGVVTALEFRLHPLTHVYGGNLYYPLSRARDVLGVFADWTRRAPHELTGAVAFRRFPDLPTVPAALRGQSLVALRGCWSGDLTEGERLVDRARRDLGPAQLDTFAPMPVAAMASISADPVDPLGTVQHSETVTAVTSELVQVLLDLVGPGTDHPLVVLELRTLGGGLDGPTGALSPTAHTRGAASLNAIGVTSLPGDGSQQVRPFLTRLADRLRPHVTGDTYLNYLDLEGATPQRVRAAYSASDWQRLVTLKSQTDPQDLFRFNRAIPVA